MSATVTTPPALWPQVDLLPQEIRDARRLRVLRRWLGVGLLVVVLVALIAYAGALYLAGEARSRLADAQAETSRLVAEQATYAAVPLVLGQIASVEDTRESGTSTEVLWAPYLGSLRAVTPVGVSYDSISADTGSPAAPWSGSVDPLGGAAVGQISFSARAQTLPDVAAWSDALETVPGFADPWFSSATITDEDGIHYQVTCTVDLTEAAYAQRFAPDAEVAP